MEVSWLLGRKLSSFLAGKNGKADLAISVGVTEYFEDENEALKDSNKGKD